METPIVFLIFNRPDQTNRVFERIRKARPQKLFVVADGSRTTHSSDALKCQEARRIVDEGIDWPCEVFKDYSEGNMGCGPRVSSGLDWVFSKVDRAIILEDDCLPTVSFFQFCEELLEKYSGQSSIFGICGFQPLQLPASNTDSYIFSKNFEMWGWATWKDRWEKYNFLMRNWAEIKATWWSKNALFLTQEEKLKWSNRFESLSQENPPHTWDYQFVNAAWMNDALFIHSTVSLVRNLGFGIDATHTSDSFVPVAKVFEREIAYPLIHPLSVRYQNEDIDRDRVARFFRDAKSPLARRIIGRLFRLLGKLFKLNRVLPVGNS